MRRLPQRQSRSRAERTHHGRFAMVLDQRSRAWYPYLDASAISAGAFVSDASEAALCWRFCLRASETFMVIGWRSCFDVALGRSPRHQLAAQARFPRGFGPSGQSGWPRAS